MFYLAVATIVQASLLGAQESDFDKAYQQSVATGRPLVVLIGAEWCHACKLMRDSTLPQVAKAGGLSNVVYIYVDLDRQRQLASRLKRGRSIPQLIWLKKTQTGWNGRVLIGAKSPKEVHSFVNAGFSARDKVASSSSQIGLALSTP